MSRYLIAALCACLLAAGGAALYYRGNAARSDARAEHVSAQLETAANELATSIAQGAVYRSLSNALSAAGAAHEEDRKDAETVSPAIAADLRAGNLILQQRWAGCETARLSESAAAAVERDALAELREQGAGDLVRVGRDADDQVTACQAVIRAYLGQEAQ